nr:MAG TPA_asm: hypothetical protein [Caudoviricetes sp.]
MQRQPFEGFTFLPAHRGFARSPYVVHQKRRAHPAGWRDHPYALE